LSVSEATSLLSKYYANSVPSFQSAGFNRHLNQITNYLLDNPFKTKERETITAITIWIKIGE